MELSIQCECRRPGRHEKRRLAKFLNRGGKGHSYRYQCLICGRAVSNPISTRAATEAQAAMPIALHEDTDLLRDLWQRVYAANNVAVERHIRNHAGEDIDFDGMGGARVYSLYLQTPVWRAKRAAVLARCDELCEGCRRARAEVVHHLTYEHAGDELLFELVGLCRGCHEQAHAK